MTLRQVRSSLLSCLAALLACVASATEGQGKDVSDPALLQFGERMYREGVMPSGEVMSARLRGDVSLRREQSACITCHRRSGLGSSEGQTVALPVTGEALYSPRDPSVRQLAHLSSRTARRPAYTDATLARAIREGIDAAGQPIAEPMPRYALSDEELAPLIAYLKSLSKAPSPGVSAEEIHFATVVTDGVPPQKRKAMLDVLEAFIRDKNAGTRYETRRLHRGPWTMTDYRAYRTWRLHLWELTGAPETWSEQLAGYYRQQPVFAMLAGLAAGPWQPVHTFCEENRIPCLFPTTDLPVVSADDFYPIYFSAGMTLEASALARFVSDTSPPGPIVQIVGPEAESVTAARVFRNVLAREGRSVEEVTVESGLGAVPWREVLGDKRDAWLVLWSREHALPTLAPWAGAVHRIVLSSTLLGSWPQVTEGLSGKVAVVHPYVLPEQKTRHLGRVRAWLRAKGITSGDERIQANTYFAVTVAGDALMQMANNFSRDYFIERIEDMAENALTSSVYPRVSLAPGQRFAAKGAYVVTLPAPGKSAPEVDWIVP